MPDSAALRAIRQYIAANWEELLAITNDRKFKRLFGELQGERLVRPPSGFPADHPAIHVLRQKQFYVSQSDPAELAEGPKLFARVSTLFSAMIPLVRFLNTPLESLNRGPSEDIFGRSTIW